ncbi:MAG: PAS domain S-box protein [Cyclobacteriaceae bacterium]
MIEPQTPQNENERLRALEEYKILDTLPEDIYDDITKIAAQISDSPIALISLVDDTRQWFKSHHGLDVSETPKKIAFCAHAIGEPDKILEVSDSFEDERFHDNPLVTGKPHVRFYAGAPLKDKNGYPLGTLCVIDHKVKNLSKTQKQALWALSRQVVALLELRKQNHISKAMESDLKDILENLGDGVFELDSEGKTIYVNAKMGQMLNRPHEEIVKTPVWDMIHKEDVEQMKIFYADMFRNGITECSYTYRLNPAQKPPLWVEQRTTMQYEGKRMVKLRSIARDISENMRLKEQLKTKESLFKLVSENSSDVIALHEPNGIYKFISQSSKDLLGYDSEEMIGKNPYDFIHPDDISRLQEGAHKSTLDGESVQKVEYRLRKKDQSYIWLESYTKPIVDENGEVTSFQTSSRDITTKREEREQLLIAKIKAEEASNAKNSFLSMMSHEIRTPLNGIIGTTHLLLNKQPLQNQLAHLNILKRSGDNLLAIVNDILDLNKIEDGKIEIDVTEFNLRELATLIYENYLIQAEEKRIEFLFEYDESLVDSYHGDQVRISQILHNLISNAIKFTEEGEVKFLLKRKNQHDSFDEILFEIQDSGIGIPKARQKDVFDTFVQAEKNTTQKYGGSGLGLSITKKLLKLMDSEIHLSSDKNDGSTFHFSLALQRVSIKEKSNKFSKSKDLFDSLSGSVLIVEDNDFNRLIARDFLKSWDCTVLEAINGKEALDILESQRVDLVLLDLQMPIMDGFETIKHIRSREDSYFKELPVIALTASAMAETKESVFESGINDFITKPFLPTEFYNKVASRLKLNKTKSEEKDFESTIRCKLEDTFGDNPEKINRYRDIFKETIKAEIKNLEEALIEKDLKAIRTYAHKIKSSLKMVGLDEIANDADEMEKMVDRNNPDSMILDKAKLHNSQINQLVIQLENQI